MTTHPLQFGKHPHAPGHSQGKSAGKLARGYFMPKKSATQSNAEKQHAALVQNTEKWVAQTFYGEMLKQMRNSPFRSKMFDGGEGGKTFNQMFDSELAGHLSRGAGKKLVDTIVKKIEHPNGESKAAADAYAAQSLKRKQPKVHAAKLTPAMMARVGVNP
jgi:Rod binding domain-containing protein